MGIHNPPPDIADEPPKRLVLSTIIGSRPASLAARAAVKAADPEPTTTTFFELFSIAIPPHCKAGQKS